MSDKHIIAGLETELERLRGHADLLARADVLLADLRPCLIAAGRWELAVTCLAMRAAIGNALAPLAPSEMEAAHG